MKISLSSAPFYFFLLLILIIEGLGFPSGRIIARYLICGFPALLFLIDIGKKKIIHIPVKLTSLFILFSIAAALSTISAINVQTAFEHQLYYIGVFLFFLYVYNHKTELKEQFFSFIALSTGIVFVYAVFINWLLPDTWSILIPITGYQFVYLRSNASSHYSFGSFVLIPLICSFLTFWNKPRFWNAAASLFLFILLLLSFLRSAYLAFTVVVILAFVSTFKAQKKYVAITFLVGISSLLFFLSITNFDFNIPVISSINDFLISKFEILTYKSIINGRVEFITQAIEAIVSRPFTGFGSYNFYYAAMRFAQTYETATGTSHNLFLDIFVENGLPGGIVFVTLIVLLVRNSANPFTKGTLQEKSIYGILIALLVLFQFGHYHKFYFLFILFFFTAGLLYSEKNTIQDRSKTVFVLSGVLFLINMCIVVSYILMVNKKYSASYRIYPLSVPVNQALVYEYKDRGMYGEAELQLMRLNRLYPQEPFIADFIGNYYSNASAPQEAITYYKQALQYSPRDVTYVVFIYDEMEKIAGKQAAREYVTNYLTKHKIYTKNSPWDSNKDRFKEWCTSKKIECVK